MTEKHARESSKRLPFGYISLETDGTIKRFSPFGSDDSSPEASEVLGKHFFREVFRFPEAEKLEQKFNEFMAGGDVPFLSANVNLKGHRVRRVHVGFVRSPLEGEVIVTVNPIGHEDLPLSAQIRPDPVHGTLSDAANHKVVIANDDFWRSFASILQATSQERSEKILHWLGREWGMAHAVRVESFVQRENSHTLGELQIQIALEYLSGSLAVIGLGNFEVDLGFRQQGVVVINHHSSPFPSLIGGEEQPCCSLLAGFHAGLVSYLSGRDLCGFELFCSSGPHGHCRMVIGTEARLRALRNPDTRSTDARLLEDLRDKKSGKDASG